MSREHAQEAEVLHEEPPLDRAQGSDAPPRKRLTVRQEAVGRERLADPKASEGRIMVRGGYSASSARKPAEILGGTSRDLARRVIQEQPDSLSALRPLSLRTLREIISDDGVSAQTRANAAGGVLRLAAELGEDEQAGEITDEDRIAAHVYRLRLLRLGMLLCARYGFAVALERLDKAAHARLGMSLQDARMRQPRAAAAPSRRVHRVGSE